MKNIYDKKIKVKVHPSPSSSSFCTQTCRDALSLLTHLLPTAIIALASALTLSDQEVLAYMITRSIDSAVLQQIEQSNNRCKRPTKNHPHYHHHHHHHQKSPIFSCDCFDCYTCYWVRWDSSPNRDLIDKAIEAFEEHLVSKTEHRSRPTKSKRKDKMGRRSIETKADSEQNELLPGSNEPESEMGSSCSESPENGPNLAISTAEMGGAATVALAAAEEEMVGVGVPASTHRSSGRKSWPDVLGSLHSRIWSLWGSNI